MLWTDNLMIPKAAQHKGTAELLINYYYDPAVNAILTAGVDYISPVKGTDELMIAADPAQARQRARDPAAGLGGATAHLRAAVRGGRPVLQRAVRQGGRRRLSRPGGR